MSKNNTKIKGSKNITAVESNLKTINSHNKTVIINNIGFEKRKSEKEIAKKKLEENRPYLKHRLNERICCFGYVVNRYRETKLITVINLVDFRGNYITDHVQLDLKTDIYGDYNIDDLGIIKIKGVVRKYKRKDGTEDYCIDLIDEIQPMCKKYINLYGVKHYDYNEINIDKVKDFITTESRDNLLNIIDKLRIEINRLTSDDFGLNFIYGYIINQYMINRATYDLYMGNLNKIKISEDAILDIMLILSSIVYVLHETDWVSIDYLFKMIAYICNSIQGIDNNGDIINEKFEDFCINKLLINKGTKIKKLIYPLILRIKNFGKEPNPNPEYLNPKNIIQMSYMVLDNFIN